MTAEDLLQGLLARYPRLLTGDDPAYAGGGAWLLVEREVGVPDNEEAPDRWSVDHLFIDQNAVPTLVEVKRSTDTRIRREVVGQMLDYAANAIVYWPVETIRAKFEARCEGEGGQDPAQVLASTLGPDIDPEAFWQDVKTNLQAGRVRMLFVSDVIPPELRRVVEFLNEQMDPAEVLALEVRQFVGQGLQTLVPRLIGQAPEGPKGGQRETRKWDELSFFEELLRVRGNEDVEAMRRILEWSKAHTLRLTWGTGKKTGTCMPWVDTVSGSSSLLMLGTDGSIVPRFGELSKRPPFDDETKRREFLDKLNAVSGINLPPATIDSYWQAFPAAQLRGEGAMAQFLAVLDWAVGELKAAG